MSVLGYSYTDAEPSLKNLTTDFGKIPEKQDDVCALSVAIAVLLLVTFMECKITGFEVRMVIV
jgi:hypothetical protein